MVSYRQASKSWSPIGKPPATKRTRAKSPPRTLLARNCKITGVTRDILLQLRPKRLADHDAELAWLQAEQKLYGKREFDLQVARNRKLKRRVANFTDNYRELLVAVAPQLEKLALEEEKQEKAFLKQQRKANRRKIFRK